MTRPNIRARTLASLLALGGFQLAGCAGTPAAPVAPDAAVTLDRGFAAPGAALPPLVDRSQGIALHSCADLIAALRAAKDLGELAESPRFNGYVDCMAMALIADGHGPRDASFDVRHAGERIYRDLDLASVASSLAPRRPSEHYRLQDFKFDSVQVDPLSAVLQGNGFSYTFQVLALGDFRHLGKTELLVRFTDRATNQGTYDKQSVLVLDATPPSTALQATDAIEVLKAGAPAH
jgi:hypothetical protein